MSWDWSTFWFAVLIGLLILALLITIFWFLSIMSKRRGSHVELYFDENFRKIISEWDLLPRDRVKEFKTDMRKRLHRVGTDISYLEEQRVKLNRRLEGVEKEMSKLEVF